MSLRTVGLVIGVVLVGAGGAAVYLSTRNDALDAYNSAPRCASLADAEAGEDCRFTDAATIYQSRWDGDSWEIDVVFPGPYVRPYPARVPAGAGFNPTLVQGEQVPVPSSSDMTPIGVSDAIWR